MTPNPQNIGAAPEEYPIRALVKVCAISMGSDMPGRVFKWKRDPNGNGYLSEPGRYDSRDPSDFPFQWCAFSDELIINPTPEQIAEERAKAGLSPQEGEALPEAQPKGPSLPEVTQPGEGVEVLDLLGRIQEAAISLKTTLDSHSGEFVTANNIHNLASAAIEALRRESK